MVRVGNFSYRRDSSSLYCLSNYPSLWLGERADLQCPRWGWWRSPSFESGERNANLAEGHFIHQLTQEANTPSKWLPFSLLIATY